MLLDTGNALVDYRFTVVIFTAAIPNPIDIAFQDVSGLKMSRNIMRRGKMTTLDGQPSVQTLTLKRGVFSGISPLTIGNSLESLFWETRLLRKDLLISVLNENGDPANAWIVSDAYLEAWDWGSLSGESNKVLVETMSFKYSNVNYVPLTF